MSKGAKRKKLAMGLSILAFATALVTVLVLLFVVIGQFPENTSPDQVKRAWMLGGIIGLLGAVAVLFAVLVRAGGIASRVNDLGLAVAKLGRGSTEVRVKVQGSDEVGALAKVVSYLAGDLAEQAKEQQHQGVSIAQDPQVRELRDRTVREGFEAPENYELDAALCRGTRGGLDYFDVTTRADGTVAFLVRGDGASALAAVAGRMARDQLLRALEAGGTARKALAHANKVLHEALPRGACALALVLELKQDEVKLYQAGMRHGALVCARGEVTAVAAEGLALGLDAGPVFEKALRSTKIPVTPGVRCVLVNEAGSRVAELADLLRQHSPKSTMAFMGLVLSAIEESSGEGGLREDVVLITAKRV